MKLSDPGPITTVPPPDTRRSTGTPARAAASTSTSSASRSDRPSTTNGRGRLPESEGLDRPFTRRFDRLKLLEQRLVQGEIILGGGE